MRKILNKIFGKQQAWQRPTEEDLKKMADVWTLYRADSTAERDVSAAEYVFAPYYAAYLSREDGYYLPIVFSAVQELLSGLQVLSIIQNKWLLSAKEMKKKQYIEDTGKISQEYLIAAENDGLADTIVMAENGSHFAVISCGMPRNIGELEFQRIGKTQNCDWVRFWGYQNLPDDMHNSSFAQLYADNRYDLGIYYHDWHPMLYLSVNISKLSEQQLIEQLGFVAAKYNKTLEVQI